MVHECHCPTCTNDCDMDVPICDRCREYGCTEVDSYHE